jgi:2-phosphosulfolactate phosphatase
LNATVAIDCFAASVARYRDTHTIVAIDVIRATTVAVTAVATGRRCVVAADVDDAFGQRDRLGDALLAGEIAGTVPEGFDMNNSPAELAERRDVHRPLVMISSSGTPLMLAAATSAHGAYAACFRNFNAVARHLVESGRPVAVIGAGSRNEFREEDQMCCAWIAQALVAGGYGVADRATGEAIERWRDAPSSACETGNSVGYLRRSGQLRDIDFILDHVSDLDLVCAINGNEVAPYAGGPAAVD